MFNIFQNFNTEIFENLFHQLFDYLIILNNMENEVVGNYTFIQF